MALESDIHKKSVMVVGGGMAGMTAAQTLNDHGITVHLIEKNNHLGGHAFSWSCMATDSCQHCSSCLSPEAAHSIQSSNLNVYLNTHVAGIDKKDHCFSARLQGDCQKTIEASSIIVATGFTPASPEGLLGQSYNSSDNIITTAELNQNLKDNTMDKFFPQTDAPKIGFIQCVGSRNREKGRDYCSQVCCKISLRHIKKLIHLYPNAKICLFYIDLQLIGKETRAQFESLSNHIDLVQGAPFEIFTHDNGTLSVIKEDEKSGNRVAAFFDMMVLSVGIQPSDSSLSISDMLDMPLNQWGFIDDPASLAKKNIYTAGCVTGPADILTAKQQGMRCAQQIIQNFESAPKDQTTAHTRVAIIGDGDDARKAAQAVSDRGHEPWIFGLKDKTGNDKKEIKIPDTYHVPAAELISINGAVGNFSIVYTDAEKTKQQHFSAIIVAQGAVTVPVKTHPPLSKTHLLSLDRFLDCAADKPEDIPNALVFWLDHSQPENKAFSRMALTAAIALAKNGKQVTFILNKMLVHKLEGQQLYDTARNQGIRFLRINTPDDVNIKQENNTLLYRLKEKTLKGVSITFESDWLIVPEKVLPGDNNLMIATLLKDHLDNEGYLQTANVRHRLINSSRKGIFYTGSCHDETDDQDQTLELDLILSSIDRIIEKTPPAPITTIEINKNKCKKCLTCFRICPHGAIVLDSNMIPGITPEACYSCGLCISSCPALAIESQMVSDTSFIEQISKDDIVVYACERSGALAAANTEFDTSIKIQEVACVCRISRNILLKTLEKGAKKIILAGCHQDNCRSIKGTQTAQKRSTQLTRIPGFDRSCITTYPVAANESVKFKTFLAKEFLAN